MAEEALDLDAIANSVDQSTNQEIPMSAPEPAPQEQTQVAAPAPEAKFYEFTADGGRQIKVTQDDPRVMQWLKMGYQAPYKLGQINKELETYKTKEKEWETRSQQYEPYKQIDEWARTNPDAWKRVEQIYRGEVQGTPAQNQAQLPPEITQKLEKHDQILTQFEQQQQYQRELKADQGLQTELESIQKKYPNLDFYTPDKSGSSLEAQILDHAIKNHIPSFSAAFKDYYHDDLVKMAEEKGREATGKSLARTKNLGLQGKTPAPSANRMASPNLSNIRQLSYEQLHQQALSELGLDS